MPIYNLEKVDVSQLLAQMNGVWSKMIFTGFFEPNKKEMFVESKTLLHNFNLSTSDKASVERFSKFKGRFTYYMAGQQDKPNELKPLIALMHSFKFTSQVKVTVTIKNGNFWRNRVLAKHRKKKEPPFLARMLYISNPPPILRQHLNRLYKQCFKVSVKVESANGEAFQFLAALKHEYNHVASNWFFLPPKVLLTKEEMSAFLNLDTYCRVEVKKATSPILLGYAGGREKIELDKERLHEHLKIEGLPQSGKSGLMVIIFTKLVDDLNRVVLIDPHDSTTNLVFERVRSPHNIEMLEVEKGDRFLGINPLVCLKASRGRKEHVDTLSYAFFASESENGQLATTQIGHDLLTAAVEFNYNYFQHLRSLHLPNSLLVQIFRDRQLTLNDLKRFDMDTAMRLVVAEVIRGDNPMLANQIADIKQFNQQGLAAAMFRFSQAVFTTSGMAFFESTGFNVMHLLEQNKSVFCNIKSLSKLSRGIISTLVYSDISKVHMQENKRFKGKTYLGIDEAVSARFPELMQVVSENNKHDLHLVLAYQSLNMWNITLFCHFPSILNKGLPRNKITNNKNDNHC